MRDRIINTSINGLQKEGLRFSVDSIAKELKISKKTVYKIFPSKEDLAVAVYEKFYDDIESDFDDIIADDSNGRFLRSLDLFYRSYCMIREELFNKYALNGAIRELALSKHGNIQKKFRSILRSDDADTAMFIIDGVFEKLDGAPLPLQISRKLERLIC